MGQLSMVHHTQEPGMAGLMVQLTTKCAQYSVRVVTSMVHQTWDKGWFLLSEDLSTSVTLSSKGSVWEPFRDALEAFMLDHDLGFQTAAVQVDTQRTSRTRFDQLPWTVWGIPKNARRTAGSVNYSLREDTNVNPATFTSQDLQAAAKKLYAGWNESHQYYNLPIILVG